MTKQIIGSVSSGTLRNEDLLEAFAWTLRQVTDHPGSLTMADEADAMREADELDYEKASELVNDLIDLLSEYAPPYFYFGAHPGDGADFGFWLSESAIDDFDGLKVDDTSEVPDDYTGEIMHINDHGNVTLYARDLPHSKLREIWAIV